MFKLTRVYHETQLLDPLASPIVGPIALDLWDEKAMQTEAFDRRARLL
jgi:hypothetical protein